MFTTFNRDTENIQKYRLSRSELSNALYQLAVEHNSKLKDVSDLSYLEVESNNKRFIICPMSKDAETLDNESSTPYIWNTIKLAKEKFDHEKPTLLIPLRLCRGYLKAPEQYSMLSMLKRKHAVLVEVSLLDNKIEIHDSQGWFRQYCYPDKINQYFSREGFQYDYSKDYHAYGRQTDPYSCGYYVHGFIDTILKSGDSKNCANVVLDIANLYADKDDFLKKHNVVIEAHQQLSSDDDMAKDEEIDRMFTELNPSLIAKKH